MSGQQVVRGGRPWWGLACASLAVAGFTGMAEAGAVVLEATPDGQFSVSSLYGIGQLTKLTTSPVTTLDGWARAQDASQLATWLLAHLFFDVLFVAGYALLGVILLAAASAAEPAPGPAGREPAWRAGRWVLLALVVANLAQVGLAALAVGEWIRRQRDVPSAVAWLLHGATILKWLAAVALLVWAAYRVGASVPVRTRLRQVARAVKNQRFSVVILVLLGVIAVSRGSDVLEQMPDVERAWLTRRPGLGGAHLAAAVLAQILLAGLLFYLGRLRVRRASQKYAQDGDARFDDSLWPWLVAPAALVAVTGVLRVAGWAEVSWLGAIAIPAVMGTVVLASLIFWKPAGRAPVRDQHAVADAPEMIRLVHTVGDLLAVAVIAVPGLGLVRAFTAPALVLTGWYARADAVAVGIGIVVALAVWPAAYLVLGRAAARSPREPARAADGTREPARPADGTHGPGRADRTGEPGEAASGTRGPAPAAGEAGKPAPAAEGTPGLAGDRRRRRWPVLAATALLAAADALLIFVPLRATHVLGVLGTAVIGLGTLTVGLAGLAHLAQRYQPPAVFRLMRLSSTPVISLLVIAGILGLVIDKNSRLHDIRLPAGPAGPAASAAGRPAAGPPNAAATSAYGSPPGPATLAASLQQWLADPLTKSCAVAAPAAAGAPPVRVEPLVMVAASGGGIRAAWWATHTMEMVAGTACGRHGVFAVSSVSGGSLGMAVLATSRHPDATIRQVAGPDALAAAIDGLVLRDTIAGFTGLDLTAAQMLPQQRYPDRAALMEHAWEAEGPGLRAPFPLARPTVPWRLLFNATAVRTGCRAILPDRALSVPGARPPAAGPPLTCGLGSAAPAANSYDLFGKLPCLRGIDAATAALLSARFTFITPSGVVNGCGKQAGTAAEQFVDGGYADSSGLATLAGLAPGLTAAVRQYNTAAVAAARPGQPVTLVVPVTAYLGNSPQVVPAPTAPGSVPELIVPLHASSASGALTTPNAFLQQIAEQTAAAAWLPCAAPAAAAGTCGTIRGAAALAIPRQLVLITPQTRPRVAAPLGWVLSLASRMALAVALQQDADGACRPAGAPVYCPAGTGGFRYLLRLLHVRPGPAPG